MAALPLVLGIVVAIIARTSRDPNPAAAHLHLGLWVCVRAARRWAGEQRWVQSHVFCVWVKEQLPCLRRARAQEAYPLAW